MAIMLFPCGHPRGGCKTQDRPKGLARLSSANHSMTRWQLKEPLFSDLSAAPHWYDDVFSMISMWEQIEEEFNSKNLSRVVFSIH